VECTSVSLVSLHKAVPDAGRRRAAPDLAVGRDLCARTRIHQANQRDDRTHTDAHAARRSYR
jgi:hypothetical protein